MALTDTIYEKVRAAFFPAAQLFELGSDSTKVECLVEGPVQ